MKPFRKPQKNICKNSLFLTFYRYIYYQIAKSVELPVFIDNFKKPVYAKESSHIGVGADVQRWLL